MRKIALLVGCLVAVGAASAQYINDDFESYADTTALNAVWTRALGTDADTFLDVDPTDPLNQVVRDTIVTSRRDQNFGPHTVSGAATFIWSFDYYDFVGNTADPRNYGQLLSQASGGGLNELLAMGQYNAAASHNRNKYQARVAFGGAGWFNLNTDRSVGWHNFTAVIGATTVDFYVDGVLDTAGVAHVGVEWYQARIGSGLSSAGGAALYDNYLVTPEPASLALLALGALAALRRR